MLRPAAKLFCAVSFCVLALARAAEAEEGPEMPLGEVAAAPAGLLEYCALQPLSCADAGETPSPMLIEARRVQAQRLYWTMRFSEVDSTLVAHPAAGRVVSTSSEANKITGGRLSLLVPSGAVIDAAFPQIVADTTAVETGAPNALETTAVTHEAAMSTGRGALAAGDVIEQTELTAPVPGATARYKMDKEGWALVNRVNRRVNRAIRFVDDRRQYGRDDVWAAPVGRGSGDCEDYVLAKRRELIDRKSVV